jgi:hypothetical protein
VRYLNPELALIMKAKLDRPKDTQDLVATLPQLRDAARQRLRDYVERTHPGHAWLGRMGA